MAEELNVIGNGAPAKPVEKKSFWATILIFLSLIGPGLITGNFGNDAGGITTYSVCGADFGLGMIWMVLPVTVILLLYQEMSGRLGAVTGKGLSDLIRENFGIRIAFYLMIGKFLAGIANTTAEFGGIAASMELFGVNKYISVPLMAILVWLLTIKANYRKLEKIFFIGIAFFACYIVAGLLSPIDWHEVAKQALTPSFRMDSQYLMLLVALIGTTIAPWMVFYHQSAVVEKGISIAEFRYFRWELPFVGISVGVVIFFIIVTCSPLYSQGIRIETAQQAAMALVPLAGVYAKDLFAIGLLIASLGAAMILPISTAFSVCEIFGWESGVNKKFMEAPQFYGMFTIQIILGAAIILIPGIPLIQVMILSQTINGLLLPFVLVIMLILINKKKLMGEYANGPIVNFVAVAATIAITASVVILIYSSVFGS
ncbi:MAG: Nramp family divalent metal transporter [Candidatus Brocadiia bacterium]